MNIGFKNYAYILLNQLKRFNLNIKEKVKNYSIMKLEINYRTVGV
jgi:hypothetical protein